MGIACVLTPHKGPHATGVRQSVLVHDALDRQSLAVRALGYAEAVRGVHQQDLAVIGATHQTPEIVNVLDLAHPVVVPL